MSQWCECDVQLGIRICMWLCGLIATLIRNVFPTLEPFFAFSSDSCHSIRDFELMAYLLFDNAQYSSHLICDDSGILRCHSGVRICVSNPLGGIYARHWFFVWIRERMKIHFIFVSWLVHTFGQNRASRMHFIFVSAYNVDLEKLKKKSFCYEMNAIKRHPIWIILCWLWGICPQKMVFAMRQNLRVKKIQPQKIWSNLMCAGTTSMKRWQQRDDKKFEENELKRQPAPFHAKKKGESFFRRVRLPRWQYCSTPEFRYRNRTTSYDQKSDKFSFLFNREMWGDNIHLSITTNPWPTAWLWSIAFAFLTFPFFALGGVAVIRSPANYRVFLSVYSSSLFFGK